MGLITSGSLVQRYIDFKSKVSAIKSFLFRIHGKTTKRVVPLLSKIILNLSTRTKPMINVSRIASLGGKMVHQSVATSLITH